MQALSRRQGQCILCALRSQYAGVVAVSKLTSASSRRQRNSNAQASRQPGQRRSNVSDPSSFRPRAKSTTDTPRSKPRTHLGVDDGFGDKVKVFNPTVNLYDTDPRRQLNKRNEEIKQQLKILDSRLQYDPIFQRLDLSPRQLRVKFSDFRADILNAIDEGKHGTHKVLQTLGVINSRQASEQLLLELRYMFYGYALEQNADELVQREFLRDLLCDFRYPYEWYPATRSLHRDIHLHIGPTNSGKTYHALKRLEDAKCGVYASPLRLLAHEVYLRLNARGIRCNLVTGDDRRVADATSTYAPMRSCTVEMVPLNETLDVAVIDEIQMLASPDRGWAWTQAFLGLKAKELHLCGEPRTLAIVKQLTALCGDTLHVHEYKRLTPLEMMNESLHGKLKNLQKGDCVVSFSIQAIHAMRQAIERALGVKCAVIYGSLPPETRVQQARLFNDPDNDYDILVASNAIGMGLNLSIKRMVFQTSHAFLNGKFQQLPLPEIKQIAGRAGRYSTADQDMKGPSSSTVDTGAGPKKAVGRVTTLEKIDFQVIEKAMHSEAPTIKSACITPPAYLIDQFSQLFPANTPFTYILTQIREHAKTTERFHMFDFAANLRVADAIETVQGLSVNDRLIFCAAPIDLKRKSNDKLIVELATLVAENRSASVLDLASIDLDLLEDDFSANRDYLSAIESLHHAVINFLWLNFRFPGVFLDAGLAMHVKELIEHRIEDVLAKLSFDFERMRRGRESAIMKLLKDMNSAQDAEQGLPAKLDDDVLEKLFGQAQSRDSTVTNNYEKGPANEEEDLTDEAPGTDEFASSGEHEPHNRQPIEEAEPEILNFEQLEEHSAEQEQLKLRQSEESVQNQASYAKRLETDEGSEPDAAQEPARSASTRL